MFRFFSVLIAVIGMTVVLAPEARPCSRVVYKGADSLVVVGRSLDWKTPIPTNMWVFPRGMVKRSDSGDNALEWTSKYGSVCAVSYDGGVTEGMNEKGLVINGLFCRGTVYGDGSTAGKHPMSLAVFVEWMLDLNATTDEVVASLREADFEISGQSFDNGTVATLHWGITDRSGKTAVLEIDHGRFNIYTGDDMPVLTNDPSWPAMQAIDSYWTRVGGSHMLPGGVSSPDRFVRASFFVGHVAKVADGPTGVSIARSILANVSVPYTYISDDGPNVSSTQWRTFADLRDLRYYYDMVTSLGVFYIDFARLDFTEGAQVLRLDTSSAAGVAGEANGLLEPRERFTPMY